MVRMPSLRTRLDILCQEPGPFTGLCEAYEDASVTYFNLLRRGPEADPHIVREYREICAEIEEEVKGYCFLQIPNVPK